MLPLIERNRRGNPNPDPGKNSKTSSFNCDRSVETAVVSAQNLLPSPRTGRKHPRFPSAVGHCLGLHIEGGADVATASIEAERLADFTRIEFRAMDRSGVSVTRIA